MEAARSVDNDGERRRKVKEMLVDALQVKGSAGSLDLPRAEVTWRGTRREVAVVFGNVRDPVDLPDEMLRADTRPRGPRPCPRSAGCHLPPPGKREAASQREARLQLELPGLGPR